MTGAATASRSTLIFLICVPLAVLMGYMLAEPTASTSMLLLLTVVGIISIPLFLRWQHGMLLFSCNAVVFPYFLPGRPPLWLPVCFACMFLLIVDRAMSKPVNLFHDKKLSWSLIFLGIVTVFTAYANGTSFGSLSSSNSGGKRYFYILAAIFSFFCLATNPIKPGKVPRFAALYFLSGLTSLVGYIALVGGPSLYFLGLLFPIEGTVLEYMNARSDLSGNSFERNGGLGSAALALMCFLGATYGIRGMLEIRKPWRLFLLILAVAASLFSGYRSVFLLIVLIFGALFVYEGLLKTRYFLIFSAIGVISLFFLFSFSSMLPQSIQRTICFLPLEVDLNVRAQADDSSNWRLEMWKELMPMVPKYLLKGKGYGINSSEVHMAQQVANSGFNARYEVSILTGDYHSGPLSVIIPLGLAGAVAFIWFLLSALRILHLNYVYGNPSLKTFNTFIISLFVAHILCFIFVFGSLYSDLIVFTSLAGFSLGINGGVAQPPGKTPKLFLKK